MRGDGTSTFVGARRVVMRFPKHGDRTVKQAGSSLAIFCSQGARSQQRGGAGAASWLRAFVTGRRAATVSACTGNVPAQLLIV